MVSFTGKTNYSQDLICAQSRRRNIIIFLLTYKFLEINLDVPCLPLIISIHHITSTPHTSCVLSVFRFMVYTIQWVSLTQRRWMLTHAAPRQIHKRKTRQDQGKSFPKSMEAIQIYTTKT